jgi:hypothetical protein
MGGGGGRKPKPPQAKSKPRLLGQARPEHHYKLLPTSLYVIVTAQVHQYLREFLKHTAEEGFHIYSRGTAEPLGFD